MITDRKDLIESLDQKVKQAALSKWTKTVMNASYFPLIIYKKIIFPVFRFPWYKRVRTFYQKDLLVHVPGSFDIAVYGVKLHDSEVRLAKFMIQKLHPSQTFLDIGAHIGYFSVLASELIKDNGRVIAIEPSKNTYRILRSNTANEKNIRTYNLAISDKNGQQLFMDFPDVRSEDNRLVTSKNIQTKADTYPMATMTLDALVKEKNFLPSMIKIDVEGGESKVIKGGETYLQNMDPVIIMEVLKTTDKKPYWSAMNLLEQWGFQMYRILENGGLSGIENREEYYTSLADSDNVVFLKAPN